MDRTQVRAGTRLGKAGRTFPEIEKRSIIKLRYLLHYRGNKAPLTYLYCHLARPHGLLDLPAEEISKSAGKRNGRWPNRMTVFRTAPELGGASHSAPSLAKSRSRAGVNTRVPLDSGDAGLWKLKGQSKHNCLLCINRRSRQSSANNCRAIDRGFFAKH